ncbi:uncharacterized protein LOC110902566 [Helianthus annuus]|uniref:uncharacterized protein LOC110902566 n=1 Tax=Helianthus annuus TaxID=4232 RepID=UPI001652DA87|nr:uncharacterized protein LOC110902566 [Helianthus annuus]
MDTANLTLQSGVCEIGVIGRKGINHILNMLCSQIWHHHRILYCNLIGMLPTSLASTDLMLDSVQKMLDSDGSCILHNIKTGIWIADLQVVRCPICDLNTCDGTM